MRLFVGDWISWYALELLRLRAEELQVEVLVCRKQADTAVGKVRSYTLVL